MSDHEQPRKEVLCCVGDPDAVVDGHGLLGDFNVFTGWKHEIRVGERAETRQREKWSYVMNARLDCRYLHGVTGVPAGDDACADIHLPCDRWWSGRHIGASPISATGHEHTS